MADGKDQILDSFKNLVDWLKSGASKAGETVFPNENGTQNFYEVAKSPVREASGAAARREMLAKLISSLLGLAASFGLTYFAVKWMTNAMDPTRKEKQKARERVIIAVYPVFEKHRELKHVKQEIALKKIFGCIFHFRNLFLYVLCKLDNLSRGGFSHPFLGIGLGPMGC